MKDNFIHVCFVIDESGSMWGSESDIIGGFNKTVEEQKAIKDGSCSVSLYRFNGKVNKEYIGIDVNAIPEFNYNPGGSTALLDAIGTAITDVGKWCADMPEYERPSKNMIVIMTDGYENVSKEYTKNKIKEMIKEQEDKYNWTFVYLGSDLSDTKDADDLGFKNKIYTTKMNLGSQYDSISKSMYSFRSSDANIAAATMDCCLNDYALELNSNYKKETGLNNLNI